MLFLRSAGWRCFSSGSLHYCSACSKVCKCAQHSSINLILPRHFQFPKFNSSLLNKYLSNTTDYAVAAGALIHLYITIAFVVNTYSKCNENNLAFSIFYYTNALFDMSPLMIFLCLSALAWHAICHCSLAISPPLHNSIIYVFIIALVCNPLPAPICVYLYSTNVFFISKFVSPVRHYYFWPPQMQLLHQPLLEWSQLCCWASPLLFIFQGVTQLSVVPFIIYQVHVSAISYSATFKLILLIARLLHYLRQCYHKFLASPPLFTLAIALWSSFLPFPLLVCNFSPKVTLKTGFVTTLHCHSLTFKGLGCISFQGLGPSVHFLDN